MSIDSRDETLEKLKDEAMQLLLEAERVATVPAPVITKRLNTEEASQSYAQQGLWVMDRVEGPSAAYNVGLSAHLRGRLSHAALEDALHSVVRRHESLRTCCVERSGRAVQIVHPADRIAIAYIDLRAIPPPRREEAFRRRGEEIGLAPFDLARDVPTRAALFACEDDLHILLLFFHHIAVDRWSFDILIRELFAAYDAASTGTDTSLPPLPIQYADYAAWQRSAGNRERLNTGLDYWERRLAGAPSVIRLPTDRSRRPSLEVCGAVENFSINLAVTKDLRQLSAANGATLFMTHLAAFAVLLARYSGDEDFSVGCPTANRTSPETEGLIGFFVNTIVLRSKVSGDPSFVELLAKLRNDWIADLEHQDTPFEAIVERVKPSRIPGYSPLFQVMFQLEPASMFEVHARGLEVSVDRFELPVFIFDLTLELQEALDGMTGRLEYRTDLFESESARRFCRHYTRLLEGIAAAPHGPISQLPMMDEEDTKNLIARFDATSAAAPPATIVELFDRIAADRPDSPALLTESGSVSYCELATRANALAERLRAMGIGPEDRIAVALPRCPDLTLALLGIMKAAAAYVPLDPDHPAERLTYILKESRAALLMTHRELEAQLPGGTPRLLLDHDPREAARSGTRPPLRAAGAASAAYVMYTSGSTGKPKGVIGLHGAAVNRFRWMWNAFPFEPGEICCHKTTITFVDSVWEMFGPLLAGVPAAMLDSETASDPRRLVAALAQYRVSRLVLVPSLLREILEVWAEAASALPPLKIVIASGEALQPALAARFRRAFPACRLLNLYGSTEVAADATWHEVRDQDLETVPIGKPIDGLAIRILDRNQRVVPVGVSGEIYVAGAGLARGYFEQSELTAERWFPDPYGQSASRMFRTGDLGRCRTDGTIEFLGRTDRQVKINGVRIEPAEIQKALVSCPGVRDAAVIVRAVRENELQLVAYADGDRDLVTAADLRKDLRTKLPASMIPAMFVVLDRLPLNTSGKIDFGALPEPSESAEPDRGARMLTMAEQVIAAIWCESLGLDHVQATSNFFDLGGNSLAAIRAVARTNETFECKLKVATLFDAPTIEEFAYAVERMRRREIGSPSAEIVTELRDGRVPASAAQRRAWFLESLEGESAIDNLSLVCRLRGPLDVTALEGSMREIVRRHEALRTRLQEQGGELFQVIDSWESFATAFFDRSGSDTAEEDIRRILLAETRRPFELGAEFPLRVTLAKISEREHILAIIIHHAASDGWSGTIFTRELNLLYREYTGGPAAGLGPTRCYSEYALWQEQFRTTAMMKSCLEAYRADLAGAPLVLALPTDHERPAIPTRRAGRERLHLDAALVERLRSIGRRSNATLFMTLLAAFGTQLHRYSAQKELLIGTPVAGRTRPEFYDVIGAFANNLLVRLNVSADASFRALLTKVRRDVIAAFDRQDVPFDALVEALRPPRDPRRFPLFQAMFVLRDFRPWLPQLGDIDVERIEIINPATRFDLTLVLDESEGGLNGFLEYARDLFEAVTIRRIAANFETLLRSIAADQERPIALLDSVSSAEKKELLACAVSGEAVATETLRLDRLMARRAAATPLAVAVEYLDERLTYAQLDCRANQLAHHLRSLEVGPGTRIAVFLNRSFDLIVSIVAILKAGAAYVPLDPAYPPERVRLIVEDARARFIIANDASQAAACPGVETINLDRKIEALAQSSTEALLEEFDVGAAAALIYTSGSTGTPKGVVITHRGLALEAMSIAKHAAVRAGDRLLQVAATGFDVASGDVATSLISGATLCLVPRTDLLPGPPLLRSLRRTRATHVFLPASMLVATPAEPLSELKVIVIGGETCPLEVIRTWSAGRRLLNAYGPTEATVTVTLAEYRGEASLPIGRPIGDARVFVLDDHQRPIPFGVAGELCIGGSGLAMGYFGKPAETAERFIADPLPGSKGERLYRTGDCCRLRYDGQFEFLGRLDRQMKIRGFRVEPGEVEAVLAAQESVARALVDARRNSSGEMALTGWLIPHPGKQLSIAAIRKAARAVLPAHMIPGELVVIDSVPLTPHGKIDWDALPAGGESVHSETAPVAPMSDAERLVAGVWCEVLARDSIGMDDNFFDSGGHSLLLVRVHRQLEKLFAREIRIVELFRFPTVRTLAYHLAGAVEAAAKPAPAVAIASFEPIAIVGMACRYPGAPDIDAFYRLIAEGTDAISRFSEEEIVASGIDPQLVRNPDYVCANGVVPDVDLFDAGFFGFSPREAECLDPQHRVFLECAWHALEDAGYAAGRGAGSVGIFAGAGMNTYLHGNLYPGSSPRDASAFQSIIGNDKDFLPTLVSYKLDLRGPSVAVQTACSTSLVAVDLACQSLQAGRCGVALAGGVSILLPQSTGYLFEPGMILSPDGACRAFDAEARGTVRSGGAGAVVLKRLSAALVDGDRILAVIRGSAMNNDGSAKVGFAAPSVEGQASVIAAALTAANVDSTTIGYIEAHGTGTELGDPIEIAALSRVFTPKRESRCAIGSVKTNIGHADAAAGIAGLIKTVLSLYHRILPPSLHFTVPNPRIDFAHSAFEVNTGLRPWPAEATPRRAGVSSFGIGGTNVHIVLEEAPPLEARSSGVGEVHVFPLSARSAEAVDTAVAALQVRLLKQPELEAGDVAFTLQRGRVAFAHRRAVVATTTAAAAERLSQDDCIFKGKAGDEKPRVAFLFQERTGGSLDASTLYNREVTFRIAFDACASLFAEQIGADVRLRSSADHPTASQWPAETAFAISYALARLWVSWGVRPEAVAGAGCGEYLAACLAGIFSLDDAVALVARHGLPLGKHKFRGALSAPKVCLFSISTGSWISAEQATDPAYWCEPIPADDAADGLATLCRDSSLILLDFASGEMPNTISERFPSSLVLTVRDQATSAAALAHLWVAGAEIDWSAVHEGKDRRRIALPTTVFERMRHWREARPLQSFQNEDLRGEVTKRADLEEWFYLPGWKQTPLPERTEEWGLVDVPWILFTDCTGVAADLASLLSQRGARVVTVHAGRSFTATTRDHYAIDPANSSDFAMLVAAFRERGFFPARLVHLWGVDDDRSVRDDLDHGLHSLIALAAALGVAGITDPLQITMIATGALDVTGAEAFRPGIAAAIGAVKVIPLEQNNIRCRYIDVGVTCFGKYERRRVVDQLLHELTSAAEEVTIAYRGAHRWAPFIQPVRLPDPAGVPDRLRRGGVYLITGGLGGAGLAVARDFARRLAAKLILVSRTPLPAPSMWRTILATGAEDARKVQAILEMEAAGSEVITAAANVADLDAMACVISEARGRFGRIDGVIHAAGVADYEGIIPNRTRQQTEAVMASKIDGTLVLEQLLRDARVDFIVLFSTLGSFLHHTKFGQVGYAAANEFLDLFAPAMMAHDGPFTVTINWDDWADVGMSHKAARRRGAVGVDAAGALAPHEGAAVLRRVLHSSYARVAVSVRPLDVLIQRDATAIKDFLKGAAPPIQARPTRESFIAPATQSEIALAAIWRDCLGVESVSALDDFFALGGHSLLATEILAGIRKQFGVTLPMSMIFEEPTIRSLAAQIDLTRAYAAEEFEL